jgi:hypothetical protein
MKQAIYVLGVLIFLAVTSFKCYSQKQEPMRHDFVKRENIKNDMVAGNYTILGTSTSETDARQIVQEITKAGYTDIALGYLSVKKSWYIYISSANDIENARAIRDQYRKIERFKDAWILTVHE